MSYILKLAGWYPSKVDAYNGDFVQRHAKAIALYQRVVVIFAVKSSSVTQLTIETTNTTNNLTEIIAYYPKKKYLDKLYSQYYYAKAFLKIIKKLFATEGKPKLVHVNIAWKAGLWALYLYKKYKMPYIITENWTAYHKADPNYILNKKITFKLLKLVFQNAAYFVPVTFNLSLVCNALFKINLPCIVVENAVDTKLFFPTETTSENMRIIHISTMNYQKNVKGLLFAFRDVLLEHPGIEITLVGPVSETVEGLIKLEPVLKRLKFTGNIPYHEVAKLVQNSDLLILFSRYENLPCVILEALCAGVTVISTRVGGIHEVINQSNGFLINNGDTLGICWEVFSYSIKNPSFNKAAIAADAASKYSYEVIGKKYNDAYEKILGLK